MTGVLFVLGVFAFAEDPTDGPPAEKVRAAIEAARKIEQQPLLDSIEVRQKLIDAVQRGITSIESLPSLHDGTPGVKQLREKQDQERRFQLQYPTDPNVKRKTQESMPGFPNSPRKLMVTKKPLPKAEQVKILEAEIAEVERRLVDLRRPEHLPLLPLDFGKLDLGSFGTLDMPEEGRAFVRVVQVLGDDEFLGTIGDYASMRKQEEAIEKNKKQGVKSKTKVIDATIPYWFRGISTSALVDGKALKLSGAFHVAGKETYATAAGSSRTVFVISPLAIKSYLKEAADLTAAVPDAPVAQEPTPKAKPAPAARKTKRQKDVDELLKGPMGGVK